ncbi:hypothetical protein [Streptomyces sp. RFCAC02]|uniref:hypothetical protein n=1 Tax=Streptomyces sp. RFCAC02 TaxID=2499143 RepID=UPI00101F3A4E|nr:hypothetical protein [Streptomyces sp. RFCAC02]
MGQAVTRAGIVQFRLKGFIENDSTDDFLQGANDEVFLSALTLDSSAVKAGADGKPVVDVGRTPTLGDISDNSVRGPWATNPHVLAEFDLRKPGDFPRTYTVTLLFVEHDNGNVAEAFRQLESQVGDKVKQQVITVASAAAAGAVAGAPIPGIGPVVGAAVGALVAVAFDGIVTAIDQGLSDDVFQPIPVTLTVPGPAELMTHPDVGVQKSLKIAQHGGDWDLFYDWHVIPETAAPPLPPPAEEPDADGGGRPGRPPGGRPGGGGHGGHGGGGHGGGHGRPHGGGGHGRPHGGGRGGGGRPHR